MRSAAFRCASIDDLGDQLRKNADTVPLRVLSTDLDTEIQQLISRHPRHHRR